MFEKLYDIVSNASSISEVQKALSNININTSILEKGVYVTVACRLAQQNKTQAVEWLRQLGAHVNAIALGYAYRGNHRLVERYRVQYGASVHDIAFGYALANDELYVNKYRSQHNASVDDIAQAYAIADNDEQVQEYHKTHHARINAIVYGYVLANNSCQVRRYARDYIVNIKDIIVGYALISSRAHNNHDARPTNTVILHEVLAIYLAQRELKGGSSGATKEYLHPRFCSFFQKSYTQKKAAVIAVQRALEGDNVDLKPHLATLRNGQLGDALRYFIKSGLAHDIVGNKVHTVRAFVHALSKEKSAALPRQH